MSGMGDISGSPLQPLDGPSLERLIENTAQAVRGLGRAARWWRSPAASTRASSPASASARSAPSTSSACACPSATSARRPPTSGSSWPSARSAARVEEPISAALEALGCYRRRDEAIRSVFPDYEPGLAPQARPLAPVRRGHRLLAGRRAARRQPRSRRMPPRRLPGAAGRDQHEAAGSQADRVHVGRPARLRRHRHAQPARVRPGLLRQGRRRPRRREADRPACTRARCSRSPRSSACRTRSPAAARRPRRSACPRPRRSSTSAIPTSRWTCWSGGAHGVAAAELAPRKPPRTRSRPPTARSSAAGWPPRTCTRRP